MFDFMCPVMYFLNQKDFNKHFSQINKQTCAQSLFACFWCARELKTRVDEGGREVTGRDQGTESFVSSRNSRRCIWRLRFFSLPILHTFIIGLVLTFGKIIVHGSAQKHFLQPKSKAPPPPPPQTHQKKRFPLKAAIDTDQNQ